MDNNTVEWVLKSMCLMPFTHVIVRHREKCGMVAIGGSYNLKDIICRFGSRQIERSFVVDDILYLDVK